MNRRQVMRIQINAQQIAVAISINFSPELFNELQVTFSQLVKIGENQNIFVGSDIQ